MNLALLLLPLLAGTGVSDVRTDTTRILVMDTTGASVKRDLVRLIDGSIAEALSRPPSFDVVTRQDVKQLVDLEAEKAAMACEGTTCLAEVAAALGARYVVYGVLTIVPGDEEGVPDTWVVQLNLVDAQEGKAIARQSARGPGALAAADNAKRAVAILTSGLLEPGDTSFADLLDDSESASAPSTTGSPPDLLLWTGYGVAGLGLLTAATGGALLGVASPTYFDPDAELEERRKQQPIGRAGVIGLVAGTAVLAAGAGLVLWRASAPAE